MKFLVILLLLLPAVCHAGSARRFMVSPHLFCAAPVTGETGDTGNYLSAWSLTGGTCGTLYYRANWDSAESSWDVWLYSDAGRTMQVGYGVAWGSSSVTISGPVHGTVNTASGPEGIVMQEGTLTR